MTTPTFYRRALAASVATFLSFTGISHAADTIYVRYNTTLGPIDVQLLPDEAPHNVANFIHYVDSGAYAKTFFHLSNPGSVLQGGGYLFSKTNAIISVPVLMPVINEFQVSNTRGTLAMAKLPSDPNSATSQWFFNDADNSSTLNTSDGGYTVFGQVMNSAGLAVMDGLNTITTYNASSLGSAFSSLPLIDYTGNLQLSNFVYVNSVVREAPPTSATVTLSNLAATFVNAAQGATVVTNPPNLGVIVTYNGSLLAPKAVGSCAVKAYINAPGRYGTASGTFVISAAVVKTAATVTLSGLTPGFNGKAHPALATTNPPNLPVTFTYNGATTPPTALGTYTVVATINDTTHSGTATGNMVISPALAPDSLAGVSVTAKVTHGTAPFSTSGSFVVLPSASDNTYGVVKLSGDVANSTGTYTYTVTSYNNAILNYTDSASGIAFVGNLTFKSATAGSYTLTTPSSPNSSQTGTFTTNTGQAPPVAQGWSTKLTIVAGTAPLASSGTATVVTSNPGNSYQIIGQNGVVSSTGTYTYALASPTASSLILNDSVVGVETVTLSWTSAKGGNFVAHDSTTGVQGGTFTSTPPVAPTIASPLTASTTLFAEFIYQITANGGVGTYGATGLPPGLIIDPKTGIISGLPTAAGTFNVPLTVTNGNTGKATLVITIPKAVATITLGGLSAPYTGKGIAATATTLPEGLKTTFTYDGKTTLPIILGNHAVTATITDANYTGTASGTLVIVQGTATIKFGNLSVLITGKPIPATVTTTPAGLAVNITYNGSATPPSALGSYPIVATINDPNYTGTASGTLIISAVLPTATTGAATLIASKQATLNATVNPKNASTVVKFEYGTTTAYGTTTSTQTVAAGTATVPVLTAITGLTPKTLYHYRVIASIGAGYTDGLDKTFTTLAAPSLSTTPTTPLLSAAGAQVRFVANPNGVATMAYFQYGTTTGYGSQTLAQAIGSGTSSIVVNAFISGLLPNTTYHYRLVTNVNGELTMGPDETFTTLGFDTALVAQKGDAATEIANATYNTFGNPIINSHDAVAFAATLNGTGVTPTSNLAIFAETNLGVPHRIVQLGDTAPDAGGAIFTSVGDPIFNSNAAVAFGGQLKIATNLVTKTTALGVWSNSSGSLHLVARQGSVAPDTNGATFSTFNALGLSDTGAVILGTLTTNTGIGVSAANNFGIWEGNTENDLALVLRTGDIVGGKTITSLNLFSTQALIGGQTRNFASDTGNLVSGAVFSDKTTGIVKVVTGTESLVAVKGEAAVGISGATFSTFGIPIINTNDRTAFAATLALGGSVTATNNFGIWADDGTGTRQLIVRSGSNNAPGTTAPFVSFNDPVYNNNQAVAFGGTLKIGTGATKTNAFGIWTNSTGVLLSVTRQGAQAPGCPTGSAFATFSAMALPDTGGTTNHGGVIFLATLTLNSGAGVTATNSTGIWGVDSTGALRLIVRTGDVIGSKTITSLVFLPTTNATDSQSRSFTQASGDLVYLAVFSDKSSAVYNVQFP